MQLSSLKNLLLCVLVGSLGGVSVATLGIASLQTGILLGVGYGVGFSFLAPPRSTTPGAGLLWGVASALLLWLANPGALGAMTATSADAMLDSLRSRFPTLVAHLLCFGAPLGIALGISRGREAQCEPRPLSLVRAVSVGSLAGLIGGWAFGKWMAHVNFYLVIAGLVHSTSYSVGVALHCLFALLIGASFGVLFRRDIRGYGSSLGWGLGYGLLWWFLGPLTLPPIFQRASIDWSYVHGAELFGSLIGHIVYGVVVGLFYAIVDRVWVGFSSSPIRFTVSPKELEHEHSVRWGGALSPVWSVARCSA